MGEHRRTEKPIQEKWKWEIAKREQWRPEHRTIAVLTIASDPAGTLVEDSRGNRYYVAPNAEGKPAGLRRLTDAQCAQIETLVSAAKEKAAVSRDLLLRPSDAGILQRSKEKLRSVWRKIARGR